MTPGEHFLLGWLAIGFGMIVWLNWLRGRSLFRCHQCRRVIDEWSQVTTPHKHDTVYSDHWHFCEECLRKHTSNGKSK